MAIDLTVQYPGKVGAATGAYPYGVPRNITAPSDGTGTPWEAAIVKDTEGFKQALLKSASIVPSGTPDAVGASEYLQSVVELASGRAFSYTESGIADAYVLDVKANQEGPNSYFTDMVVKFTAGNANTGPATINVAGKGIKALVRDSDGTALNAGDILTVGETRAYYDGVSFRITSGAGKTVILDTPELLQTYSVHNTWSNISSTTLSDAKAKAAIIKVICKVGVSSGLTSLTVKGFLGKTGALPGTDQSEYAFNQVMPSNGGILPGFILFASGMGMVNLDGSYDFSHKVTGSPSVSITSAEIKSYLVGYIL